MGKLSQILAVGVITFVPLINSNSALALGTCAEGYTGPDSNNQCISVKEYTCTIDSETTVTIENESFQVAVTGDATSEGLSSSGSATNTNGTTFHVTVTNPIPDVTEGTCAVVATVPAIEPLVTPPVATVTPVVPAPQGMGAVSSLPVTSGDSTMAYVVGTVALLGASAVVTRLAVMAYSRIKS